MEEIPNFLARLDPKKKQDITFEECRKLMDFNTERYWACFFDPKTKRLYDQFACLIMEDATQYLLDLGHIDKDMNKLMHFSK